jgi:hypothetical protein
MSLKTEPTHQIKPFKRPKVWYGTVLYVDNNCIARLELTEPMVTLSSLYEVMYAIKTS